MKFQFENIGPIRTAELELGDFTLIAGRNNTGKTYLVYTLYGFFKMSKDLIFPRRISGCDGMDSGLRQTGRGAIEDLAERAFSHGEARLAMDRATLARARARLIKSIAQDFSELSLAEVFSAAPDKFADASLQITLDEPLPETMSPVEFNYVSTGDVFSLSYDGNSVIMARKKSGKIGKKQFLLEAPIIYSRFLLSDLPGAFILSAERFGISLFYKELDFTKNRLVDLLQKMGNDNTRKPVSPLSLVDRATSRYALPIKDNIDYTRDISELREQRSEIYDDKLFNDIKEMMGGRYKSAGDEIHFKSRTRGINSFDIPLHLASSSARGLSDLYFFLRHKARKNQLLIIDEPESHLDTVNQILLARLLARFVRVGIKVLITTHSDYIVKEINNLIMLSHEFEGRDTVAERLKYSQDEWLKPTSVKAYIARNNSLDCCEIDRFGIDMPLFDGPIDKINKVSNELASHLMTEQHD